MTPTLTSRTITYLINQDTWVHKRTLTALMKKHAYTDRVIQQTLHRLENEQCIGTKWETTDRTDHDGTVTLRGQYYHGYNLTDEDREYYKRQEEGWEALV